MRTNGDLLTEWRLKKELSQEEAGLLLEPKVEQGTWAGWEANRPPELHNALQLDKLTRGQVKAENWPRRRRMKNRVKRSTPRKVKAALPPTGT